ncbi:MAG: tRNA (adenosine(37)-N6)-dimethylallyltransferase MiaA [Erysipelotrichaceae bacterium]|nr:tRNA (adenosine(37)-N6)-dimethylallyltransferase MiaA [Erysipelotrichaceae bacterium]
MSYKVIAVVGPTAVGKSDVGVRLAQLFNGEIINGDSIQVYKELNIGSAKVTEAEMQGIPHHLLDYKNVGDDYSVQQFQQDARKKIEEIASRGKLPIIVGGTGLYIKALLYDYAFTKIDTELNEYEDEDTEELYQRLLKLDPKATEVIHPNNRRRIVRALQMAESGNLKSEQEAEQKHEMIYDAKIIGLTMDRTLLKERINKRVDLMFEAGLLDEVNKLNEKYDWDMHGLHGIGYKEFRDYFLGNMTLEDTRELIKTHTRQFAKRQYTWWNNQMPVKWYDVLKDGYFEEITEDIREWYCDQKTD